MTMIRVGTDLVEVERLEGIGSRWGDRFLNRVFTPAELERGRGRRNRWIYLAGRFAAKEAVIKLLGTPVAYLDIETLADEQGAPVVRLGGRAREQAALLGLGAFSLSITHTRQIAAATAVALAGEAKPPVSGEGEN